MAKYTTLNGLFTAIANSLRNKTGGSGKIVADDFPSAIDSISTGITPTGTKTITTNGTHDVTNYASAKVNVPTSEAITVVRTVTISADVTGGPTIHPMLTGDEFIKTHYADAGFSVTLIALAPVASEANVVHFTYQGNRNIGSSNKTQTGVGLRSTSASALGTSGLTTEINGSGYGQHMRVNSSGDLYQYLHTGYILKAGTYQIVLTCTT